VVRARAIADGATPTWPLDASARGLLVAARMTSTLRFLLPALVASPLAAHAGGPPSGMTHTPPRFVDEADLYVSLWNPAGGNGGYKFRVSAHLFGVGSDADAVRVDWTQNGKTIASQRCPLRVDGDQALITACDYAPKDDKWLTTTGKISANLVYVDDQDSKEYLLRKATVDVGTFYWQKKKLYQVVADDLLGSAIAWHRTTTDEFHRGEHEVRFYFWAAKGVNVDAKFRCAIDGKKEKDLDGQMGGDNDIEMDDDASGKVIHYHWTHVEAYSNKMFWGTRDEVTKARNGAPAADALVLGEHPGLWECEIRQAGASVRTLRFKVDDKGRIEQPPAQAALDGAHLHDSEALVEIDLPKTPYDDRVRPDAIRASMPYGLPWPKDAAVQAHLKTLPAASGFPNPGKK
jgi:hypothetical protein